MKYLQFYCRWCILGIDLMWVLTWLTSQTDGQRQLPILFTEDVSMKWVMDRWTSVGSEGLHWWHSTGLCESSISSISFCAQSFWPLKSKNPMRISGSSKGCRNDGSMGSWDHFGTPLGIPLIAGHHCCWLLVLDAADSQAPAPHRDHPGPVRPAEITFWWPKSEVTEVWNLCPIYVQSMSSPIYDIYVESILICWHLHSDHSVLVPEDTSFVLGMDVWFQAICQSWHGLCSEFFWGVPLKIAWMVYFMEKTIYKWMRTGRTLF